MSQMFVPKHAEDGQSTIIQLYKSKHRQFLQYKVNLHVFSGTSSLAIAMSSSNGREDCELKPGELVAVCMKGQEELHSFHLAVFGLVDLNVIEPFFSTTRSSLQKQAKALNLVDQEWELGSLNVGEAETDTTTSSTIKEDLITFASDFAKLGDFILCKSITHSTYQSLSEFRGFISMHATISPALRPSYTSIVGTSFPRGASTRTQMTKDSALVPCLSFESSADASVNCIIKQCLGYSIIASEKGVFIIMNRYYPIKRTKGIRAMQLISSEQATSAQSGFIIHKCGVNRFTSIPKVDSNSHRAQTLQEILHLQSSLLVLRQSNNEGAAFMIKTISDYIKKNETAPMQPMDGPSWFKAFLQTFEELKLENGTSPSAVRIRNALSTLSRLANGSIDEWNGFDRSDMSMQAAFKILLLFGQSSSLFQCGQKENLPKGGSQLLQVFSKERDVDSPITVIDLDSSPSPVTEETREMLPSSEPTPDVIHQSNKRRYTSYTSFEQSASGSINRSRKEEESAKRQRYSEGNVVRSEDKTTNFVPIYFLKQVQSIIDGPEDFDYTVFVHDWSQRLKRQAVIEVALANNATLTISSGKGGNDTGTDSRSSLTKAGLARQQVKEIKRCFITAELNRMELRLTRWLKIKSIHQTWNILNDFCHEIEDIYSKVPGTSLFDEREENELRKAFGRKDLEYGKPLIDLIIFLVRFINDRKQKIRNAERSTTYAVPRKLVERLTYHLSNEEATNISVEANEDTCNTEVESPLSSAPSESDYEEEDTFSITSTSSNGIYIEWKAKYKNDDEVSLFGSLVYGTLLQIYCPQIVTCLSSTIMNGDLANKTTQSWINKRRWVIFRLELINRFANIPKCKLATKSNNQVEILGTDIFSLSILSEMIFAPSRFFPYPNRQNDKNWPNFYRYDGPYTIPCIYGKGLPLQNGLKDQSKLDKWIHQSKKVLEATDEVIRNAFDDIVILANKIRSVVLVT